MADEISPVPKNENLFSHRWRWRCSETNLWSEHGIARQLLEKGPCYRVLRAIMTDYLDPHFVRALCRDPERRTLQVSVNSIRSLIISKFLREHRIEPRRICWLCKQPDKRAIYPLDICIMRTWHKISECANRVYGPKTIRNSVNAYIHNGEKVKGHHWQASWGNAIGTFETSTAFLLLCNRNNIFCVDL